MHVIAEKNHRCKRILGGKRQGDIDRGGSSITHGKRRDMTKWFHDLYRPSLRPYDPREIALIRRFNALADEDFAVR